MALGILAIIALAAASYWAWGVFFNGTPADMEEVMKPLDIEESSFGRSVDVMEVYTTDQDRALALAQAAYRNAQQGKVEQAKQRAEQAEELNNNQPNVDMYKILAATYESIDQDKYNSYRDLIRHYEPENPNGTHTTNATSIYVPDPEALQP